MNNPFRLTPNSAASDCRLNLAEASRYTVAFSTIKADILAGGEMARNGVRAGTDCLVGPELGETIAALRKEGRSFEQQGGLAGAITAPVTVAMDAIANKKRAIDASAAKRGARFPTFSKIVQKAALQISSFVVKSVGLALLGVALGLKGVASVLQLSAYVAGAVVGAVVGLGEGVVRTLSMRQYHVAPDVRAADRRKFGQPAAV